LRRFAIGQGICLFDVERFANLSPSTVMWSPNLTLLLWLANNNTYVIHVKE
jgi:hypothetical protein